MEEFGKSVLECLYIASIVAAGLGLAAIIINALPVSPLDDCRDGGTRCAITRK